MFMCMVLGMAAEYLYHYLDAPPEKRRFDLGSFFKRFLVSPLVFMPLAASLKNANFDLNQFSAARLMIFLVAFENGFLWRGYFSRKLAESQAALPKGAGSARGREMKRPICVIALLAASRVFRRIAAGSYGKTDRKERDSLRAPRPAASPAILLGLILRPFRDRQECQGRRFSLRPQRRPVSGNRQLQI
jgi:hypothetical protein